MLYTVIFIIYFFSSFGNKSIIISMYITWIYLFYTLCKYKDTVFCYIFNHNLYYCFRFIFSHISVLCMFYTLHKQICIYVLCFYWKFITTHVQGNLNICVYFISLRKLKSHITLCIYIKCVSTDLFCYLLRTSSWLSNTSTLSKRK